MKKIALFLLVTAISFSLVGCASSDYNKAVTSIENGDYETAYSILKEIPDYEDSALKLEECEFNIAKVAFETQEYDSAIEILSNTKNEDGLALLNDCEFMIAIEESILDRMEASDTTAWATLVNTELAYLEGFYKADFFDDNLQKLSKKYIDGLYTQKNSLSEEYAEDRQREWQRGAVTRFEALNELYENYSLCVDNKKFVGTYVANLEYQRKILNAEDEIWKMLTDQYKEDDRIAWQRYSLDITFENTTPYSFDIQFDYAMSEAINIKSDGSYDLGKQFYDGSVYIDMISPGESFVVSLYYGSNTPRYIALERWDWNVYNIS